MSILENLMLSRSEEEYYFLEKRLGKNSFRKRNDLERKILSQKALQKRERTKFFSKAFCLNCVLQSLGLYKRGVRNYLDIQIIEREVYLPTLPLVFDGFRLLQLSDLHFTLSENFVDALLFKLKGVSCDAAVLTGDYCSKIGRNHQSVLQYMQEMLEVLPRSCVAVLGNYDLLELVLPLEKQGFCILLNEYHEIKRGGESFFFCGIDDPVFFKTHDLARARQNISPEACTILLAHSPEVWREAAELRYSLMLCGHTHGGQVCLPGGLPITGKFHIPKELVRGSWQKRDLMGYTSPGTGASQLPVRFNCPGEITIHILRRA